MVSLYQCVCMDELDEYNIMFMGELYVCVCV